MGIVKPRGPVALTDTRNTAVCPICASGYGGVINPDCPACAGRGVLTLGTAALAYDAPPIVADAIRIALAAAANSALDASIDPAARTTALPAAITRLARLGILTIPGGHPCAPTHEPSPSPDWSTRPRPPRPARAPIPGQLTLFEP